MQAWRLTLAGHAQPDGEGARLYGGRWNHVGTSVIYTAASLSLALLEFLVHVDSDLLPSSLVSMAVDIPDHVPVVSATDETLPEGWAAPSSAGLLRDIGTQWAASRRSAVLRVPSVIVPQEFNYVLNPNHPDFARLTWSAPVPFRLDDRFFA